MTEIEELNGEARNFTAKLRERPRYVDMEKCIACGVCAQKCPRKVDSEFNEGLGKRKAIYLPYPQAVPLKYAIDRDHCIYFEKGKCRACEKICPAGAVALDQEERVYDLNIGSVILAPGFKASNPELYEYGYGRLPNVVTSLEFERILSATGPFQGHVVRPSDQQKPKKIAWLQCVGSRDATNRGNFYCSSICCMASIKEAVIAREHSGADLETAVFYMDIRSCGKDFEKYYNRAKEGGAVRFIRSRVHTVDEVPGSGDLMLSFVEEDGITQTETFDMVVLAVGLDVPESVRKLADRVGIELNAGHFAATGDFKPVSTSREGVFVCGVFSGPKDIPESVTEASAAACAATEILATARHSQTPAQSKPPEKDVSGERPRIAVFLCNCGTNIGGVVRVPEVVEYAKTLPFVEYVEENLFTCSQDTQEKMAEIIKEKGLNRVVVAACSPRTHEPLFQETLIRAGLNKFLFEMANIRNHNSWVHSQDPDTATLKAKDLVRMAVAKSALLKPLSETTLPVSQSALVVGGGIAGMSAALSLARQGYPVHVVERTGSLGGNAARLVSTTSGDSVPEYLDGLVREISAEKAITVHLNSDVHSVQGYVGNFKTVLQNGQGQETVEHGVAVLATGAKEYLPNEYLYGKHPAVLTQLEMDDLRRTGDPRIDRAANFVFIQCVGSREPDRPYCSRVCCTHSVKTAIAIKKKNPEAEAYILYRDMRTYGLREKLYQEARQAGVFFFRYSLNEKPAVTAEGEKVRLEFRDPILNRKIALNADLLCLATAIESYRDQTLAQLFKVPLDSDGWLLEAHQKLRPVDFASDGVFLCGIAHYPKPIEESIAQAKAAASRAITVLAKGSIDVGGIVARIQPEFCSECLNCINVCPYGAISHNVEAGAAEVNEALCKGCGACAATCPSEAPLLMGFDNRQLIAQIKSALVA